MLFTLRVDNYKFIKILSLNIFLLLFMPYSSFAQIVGQEVYSKLQSQSLVRVIVVLKTDVSKFSNLNAKIDYLNTNKTRVLSKLNSNQFNLLYNWDTINAFSGFSSLEGIQILSNNPDILRIDLDISGNGGLFQSVPLINADDVKDTGFTGQGVTVAVLDTGIDGNNSNLEDDLIGEHCFCDNGIGSGCCPNGSIVQSGNGSADDDNGHGTNISGIITSDGNIPVPEGVAPGAKIVVVKVLDQDNSFSNTAQIISGLEWLFLNRPEVDVVNMSLGTKVLFENICDNQSAVTIAFFDAVQNLVESGVVVFASSQNDGSINSIALPACLSNTVSVGAVFDGENGTVDVFDCVDNDTQADQVACFSNSSQNLDLLAPGSQITSTGLSLGGISTQSGSSQASAHASATAALLLDAVPDLTPDEIKNALIQTGVTVVDDRNELAFPRINALAALNFVTGLNIEDNSSSSSICSIGGNVTKSQSSIILIIYLIPLLFIISRRLTKKHFTK